MSVPNPEIRGSNGRFHVRSAVSPHTESHVRVFCKELNTPKSLDEGYLCPVIASLERLLLWFWRRGNLS
jgi:hypothetical protein